MIDTAHRRTPSSRPAARPVSIATCIALLWMTLGARAWAQDDRVTVTPSPAGFEVRIDGQLFTEVDVRNYTKPICYPILGPGQVPMTRNYPMQPDVPGEANDHPHHKSMWCAHGDVNGTSFWDDRGKIEFDRLLEIDGNSVRFANRWLDPQGNVICTDQTTLRFTAMPQSRTIDWDVTVMASDGELVFGETKEGMMAIRTHPSLRLENDSRRGVTTANGQAINSQGVTGKLVWGKRANWIHYYGDIESNRMGIAIFDHPQNLRHPTWWHAREYGLVAANPFGSRDFGDQEDGQYRVPDGQSIRFRYRFVFHQGDVAPEEIDHLYHQYAGQQETEVR
jgi:hypothetical protein